MNNSPYRILALDGGGSKGFYTLGILTELEEKILDKPLHQSFDLIYGTSTGAIIGSLIALGYNAKEIHQLYREHVPTIMQPIAPNNKSRAIRQLADHFYGTKTLNDLHLEMGITALIWSTKQPIIFRTHNPSLNYFSHFVNHFTPTLGEAVVASCGAIPIFESNIMHNQHGEAIEIVDGGFFANNPSHLAISDAINQGINPDNITLLSLGTGEFPHPEPFQKARNLLPDLMGYSQFGAFFQNILQANTEMIAPFIDSLYPKLTQIRINPHYDSPAVDFIEYNLDKLDALFQLGITAFEENLTLLMQLKSSTQNSPHSTK